MCVLFCCQSWTRRLLRIQHSPMQAEETRFPIENKQAACAIDGNHTEVLVSGFADKIFIVITQYGRIGSLVMIK